MTFPTTAPQVAPQMAYITKRGERWFAQIEVKGRRQAQTFDSKREAQYWAADHERKIKANGHAAFRTFGDLLERYGREVSPKKPSGVAEQKRIAFFLRDPIAKVPLSEVDATHGCDFRDRRLKSASGGAVTRDIATLSHACNIARREWKWIDTNPFSDVARPGDNPARERLISDEELEQLRHAAGSDYSHATARVVAALEFAIETGMRGGEICGLMRAQVRGPVAHLTRTKNGDKRDVPLSPRALKIIQQMPHQPDGSVFGMNTASKDALFRKIKKRAGLVDINFHDSRHTAITRLSRKLDVLALARAVGHRDIRQLQTYYNESAAELAKRLQ